MSNNFGQNNAMLPCYVLTRYSIFFFYSATADEFDQRKNGIAKLVYFNEISVST